MRKGLRNSNSGLLRKSLVVFFALMMVIASTFSAFAASASDSAKANQAKDKLSTTVSSKLSANEYAIEGGGSYKGSDLFVKDGNGKDLDEEKVQELTSAAQADLVKDIARESNAVEASDNQVSKSTVQNWWKELQMKKGIGSKFMNVILENTKPDFVTANQIYQPFSGVVGTVMGIIAVVGMGLLGVVLVADIFYIVIPPVRMAVADEAEANPNGGRGSRKGASKIFSNDAIYAVRVAEENDDAGGNKKQALGVYLKRRIPMLILLGICLLYLVQGSIYTLVGYVLDLVSGFFGF